MTFGKEGKCPKNELFTATLKPFHTTLFQWKKNLLISTAWKRSGTGNPTFWRLRWEEKRCCLVVQVCLHLKILSVLQQLLVGCFKQLRDRRGARSHPTPVAPLFCWTPTHGRCRFPRGIPQTCCLSSPLLSSHADFHLAPAAPRCGKQTGVRKRRTWLLVTIWRALPAF